MSAVAVPTEIVVGRYLDACKKAGELYCAGFGMFESTVLDDGEGYLFEWRNKAGESALILLVPDGWAEHAEFVIMYDRPELPWCERGGLVQAYPTPEEAWVGWHCQHPRSVYRDDPGALKPYLDLFRVIHFRE